MARLAQQRIADEKKQAATGAVAGIVTIAQSPSGPTALGSDPQVSPLVHDALLAIPLHAYPTSVSTTAAQSAYHDGE